MDVKPDLKHEEFECTNNLQQYKCGHCLHFKTDFLIHLKQHLQDSHSPKTISEPLFYSCTKCFFETHSKYLILRHSFLDICSPNCESILPINDRLLNFCYKSWEKIGHKPQKQNLDQKVWFNCSECSYKTCCKKRWKIHCARWHIPEEDKHKMKQRKCSHCDYVARSNFFLKEHITLKHTPEDQLKWFFCDQLNKKGIPCNYKTPTKRYLQTHIKERHKSEDEVQWFECEKCDYRTPYRAAIQKHIQRKHEQLSVQPDEIQWYYCAQCSYKSKKKLGLEEHVIMKHTPDHHQWFHCDYLHKNKTTCSYKTPLLRHLQSHLKKFHKPKDQIEILKWKTMLTKPI